MTATQSFIKLIENVNQILTDTKTTLKAIIIGRFEILAALVFAPLNMDLTEVIKHMLYLDMLCD